MGTLEAALWSLAPSVLIAAAAPVSAALARKTDRAHVIAGGFVLTAAGFALVGPVDTDSLWLLLTGAGVLACGVVTVMSLVSDMALGAAPAEKAGSAASLLETGQEFGGALGMAALGSLGTAVYRSDLAGSEPAVHAVMPSGARETLGGAVATAQQLGGAAGGQVLESAREAFVHGMQYAAWGGAALLLAAAVLSAALLRGRGAQAPAPGEQAAACGVLAG